MSIVQRDVSRDPQVLVGVFPNDKGKVLLIFLTNVGNRDSNEAEVSTILEAIWIFSATFQVPLEVEVESDSSNVIGWSSKCDSRHWK